MKGIIRLLNHAAIGFLMFVGSAQAQDTVKIGYVGPLSGELSNYGQDCLKGAQMAIADLNTKGVTIGGNSAIFELVYEDDYADPIQAVARARKLCIKDKVKGVVGHFTSGTTIAASLLYQDYLIPHITPSAKSPILTQRGNSMSFRLIPNSNALASGMALLAASSLEMRRVAIIDDRTTNGESIATAFRSTALRNDIEITIQCHVSQTITDLNSCFERIRSSRSDGIFFGFNVRFDLTSHLIWSGMSNFRLLGVGSFCRDDLTRLAVNSEDIVVCGEDVISVEMMPDGRSWKDRFEGKFASQPLKYSAYSYDAVFALVKAMILAGTSDPAKYASSLREIDFIGVTGRISFDDNGELRQPVMGIYIYQGRSGSAGPAIVDAPGIDCPDCPSPSGSDGYNREDAPAVPAGCCGTPSPSGYGEIIK